jgi:tetratricopeptide (TPR) repeat protein
MSDSPNSSKAFEQGNRVPRPIIFLAHRAHRMHRLWCLIATLLSLIIPAPGSHAATKTVQPPVKDWRFYWQRGDVIARSGDCAKAIPYLEKSIRLRATPEAYRCRARAYLTLFKYDLAIKDFTALIRLKPNPDAYAARGKAHIDLAEEYACFDISGKKRAKAQNEYRKAITDCNTALALDSKNKYAAYLRALAEWRIGNSKESEAAFNYYMHLLPGAEAGIYFDRASDFANHRQQWKAIEDFTTAINLRPKFVDAYMGRASSYAALGLHQKAIDDFTIVVRYEPELASAYNRRGKELAALGNFDFAIKDYAKAYLIDPLSAGAEHGGAVRSFGLAEGMKYQYIDTQGNSISQKRFACAKDFSEGLTPVRVGQLYGYMDKNFQMVIKPQFSFAGDFHEGLACATHVPASKIPELRLSSATSGGMGGSRSDFFTGFIDRCGTFVLRESAADCPNDISFIYDSSRFSEGLADIRIGDRHAFINHHGHVVIPPLFDEVRPFSDGLAVVEMAGKYGYINKSGELVIRPQFDLAGDFSDSLAPALMLAHGPFISSLTKDAANSTPHRKRTPTWYAQELERMHRHWGTVFDDAQYGYIDRSGEYVISPQFEIDPAQKTSLVGGSSTILDASRGILEKPVLNADGFSRTFQFHEGLATINVDGKFGFINKAATTVIRPQYEWAGSFSSGLAPVRIGKKYGYIDSKGKIVVKPTFDYAQSFSDGVAVVGILAK